MRVLNAPWSILTAFLGSLALACGEDGNVEPPAEATNIAINGGNNQVAAPGSSTPIAPSVKVTDAATNPVSGVAVTFAVASGGGSVTGASQSTDASGIATVGSWTLGPTAGTNTLTATSAGLTGSPVTFTATGEAPSGGSPELAAGDFHTCGLTGPGAAYCWGLNVVGQLGDGSLTSSSLPVTVAGDLTFGAINTGYAHTCGVTLSGTAYCWGLNDAGQLGDGTGTNSPTPVAVSGGLNFTDIVPANGIGSPYTCGLTSSGAAYCWGASGVGGLGNGSAAAQSSIPVPVSGGHTFTAIDVNGGHGCGLTSAGAAYCWGLNSEGQVGSGSTDNVIPVPAAVSGGLNFSSIAVGGVHTCGLINSGAAYCWGSNDGGQLGDGSLTNSSVPIAVSGGQSFSSLAAGGFFTCGLTSSGVAYCWGRNDTGQLGNGSTASSTTPIAVPGGFAFSALAAGSTYTCGLTSSGAAYCWGRNDTGQLGLGTTEGPEVCGDFSCSTVPMPVSGWPPL
jgi:alpha-tubulin suppressor-like RCC1 family protein